MTTIRPNRQAVRDGIGQRLIELGFRRKSERLYEKDEGDLYFWSRFTFSGDDRFRETTGCVSRSLERLVESLEVPNVGQYNIDEPSPAHIYISALSAVGYIEKQLKQDFIEKFNKKMGIFRVLFDPIKRWERQNPLQNPPYYDSGYWSAKNGISLCIEESLKAWQEHVETWIAAVREPSQFARAYCDNRYAFRGNLMRGIVYAHAGDRERARWFLQRIYGLHTWTESDAIEMFHRVPKSSRMFKPGAEENRAAKSSVAGAQRDSAEAYRVAALLNVSLDEDPLGPTEQDERSPQL